MINKNIPDLVLDEIQKRWICKHTSKGILAKFIEFIIIKPIAIEITQTDTYDERTKLCIGKTLYTWIYNDAGLHLLPDNKGINSQKVEYCSFCIDKQKKKFAIVWANILSIASTRKKIQYTHHGVVYDIIENNGVEEYKLMSCWIE